jgi:insertion element IS1 protein InsB
MITIFAFLFSSLITLLCKITEGTVKLSQYKCEENPEIICPNCGSTHQIKNGSIHNGKPKHQCKNCGRQFVDNPTKITISLETKQLIDRLLLERISLRGIARVTQVSWSWLPNYVIDKFACIPHHIKTSEKLTAKLTIEC